jgi:hypothetical protein
MVICVRGCECGFPRFRVTWRERDSLTRSQARRCLPPPHDGRGAGPRERPRGPRLGVLENNHSPEDQPGGSVRRHREAKSPARTATRREGAAVAVRGRPRPQRRRPVQRAPWARGVPAPPCGRVLAGWGAVGAAPPGGAGRPIFPSVASCPLLPFSCVCVFYFFGPTINFFRSSLEGEINQSRYSGRPLCQAVRPYLIGVIEPYKQTPDCYKFFLKRGEEETAREGVPQVFFSCFGAKFRSRVAGLLSLPALLGGAEHRVKNRPCSTNASQCYLRAVNLGRVS